MSRENPNTAPDETRWDPFQSAPGSMSRENPFPISYPAGSSVSIRSRLDEPGEPTAYQPGRSPRVFQSAPGSMSRENWDSSHNPHKPPSFNPLPAR